LHFKDIKLDLQNYFKISYQHLSNLLCVILDVPDVFVQVSVDVGQLDDLGGVASLEVLGDDLAEALLALAFAVLEESSKPPDSKWTHERSLS